MDADKDRVLLSILDLDSLIKGNKNVIRPGHHRFQIGVTQLAFDTLGYVQRHNFFRWAVSAVSPIVATAMTSINDYGGELSACVPDNASAMKDSATCQRAQKAQENSLQNQTRHL